MSYWMVSSSEMASSFWKVCRMSCRSSVFSTILPNPGSPGSAMEGKRSNHCARSAPTPSAFGCRWCGSPCQSPDPTFAVHQRSAAMAHRNSPAPRLQVDWYLAAICHLSLWVEACLLCSQCPRLPSFVHL